MDIYFCFDEVDKVKEAITTGIFPNYLIYGAWHLEQSGDAKIVDMKNSGGIKDSWVIINTPKYAPAFKARGNKVILININSNHILAKKRNLITNWLLKNIYNSCHTIMCLDKSQVKPLRKFGIKARMIVNPLFIDDFDIQLSATQIKYSFKQYSPVLS